MYQQILYNVYSTPGIRNLCEERECWWLPQIIASYILGGERFRPDARASLPGVQIWLMIPAGGGGAVVTCVRDTTPEDLSNPILRQHVPTTNYDFDRWGAPKVYSSLSIGPDGKDVWVVYLPDEH